MKGNHKRNYLSQIRFSFVLLLVLFFNAIGCNESNIVRVNLEPTENDPTPYFYISYVRETTQSSNGMIEAINLGLSHIIESELVDYGTISFGDVELVPATFPEIGYFAHLQSGLPDRPFRPEFRFDKGRLFFKAMKSSMIDDINDELQIPMVSFLTTLTPGQSVNSNEDLSVDVNREVFGLEITLQPMTPINENDILTINLAVSTNTFTVTASQLQLLKANSRGKRYLLRYFHGERVDEIQVKGKNSDIIIEVPVFLQSEHAIDFVMDN